MKQPAGFSLVELSIVLVILGLLVGGILAGQSLIHAAELRSVSADYTRYQTAAMAFRDKYFYLPGDMPNATSFWGDQATGTAACASAATPDGTPGTCNGNANGQILVTPEGFRFWQHLSMAGLIEGNYDGYYGPAGIYDHVIGTNVPASRLNGGGYWVAYRSDNASWGRFQNIDHGNHLVLGSDYGGSGYLYEYVIKPEEAWNIDTKMDDGVPGQGKIVSSQSASCLDGSNYNLDLNAVACFLVLRQAF